MKSIEVSLRWKSSMIILSRVEPKLKECIWIYSIVLQTSEKVLLQQ